MIEASARVLSCDGSKAEVEIRPRSACSSCDTNSSCGFSLLASVFGRRPSRYTVSTDIHVAIGDHVVVGVPESGLARAAVVTYLAPLTGLLGGALLADILARHLGSSVSEGWVLAAAALGFSFGLFGARRLGRSISARRAFRPRILRLERRMVDFSFDETRRSSSPATCL